MTSELLLTCNFGKFLLTVDRVPGAKNPKPWTCLEDGDRYLGDSQ